MVLKDLTTKTLALAALAVFIARVAFAEDPGFPAAASVQSASALADAGEGLDADATGRAATGVEAIRTATARVLALLRGELDVAVAPGSLFEVPLDDERAVQVQVKRLSTLLRAAQTDAGADAAVAAKKSRPATAPSTDAGVDGDAGFDVTQPDADLWQAQLALDQARLSFLELPKAQRDELLARHTAKQDEARRSPRDGEPTEARRKADEAARARQTAQEQLERARSEAARLVAQVRVRLLDIRERQVHFEADLAQIERSLTEHAEVALAWRRRTRELIDAVGAGQKSSADADALYSEINIHLRGQACADLSSALDALSSGTSAVPVVGPDTLDTAGVQVDRSDVDTWRADLLVQESRLRERERELRWRLASVLMEKVESLNRDRLALYPYLSSSRRSELTDFGGPGLDQAKAEGYQVALVIRYHVLIAGRWLSDIKSGKPTATSELLASVSLLKMLGLVILFVAWRRSARTLVAGWHQRSESAAADRRSRMTRLLVGLTALVLRVRSPLEWVLLMWALTWLAGPAVANLLEVRVPWLVVTWSMGSVLVINGIDALFSRPDRTLHTNDTAVLRLRSLRLLGRVVVAVGLTLALSAELVGKGTLYGWVLETCWLAAIPIGLVVVKWWRPIIFERLMVRKKKSQFAGLLLARKQGWSSFPAAAAGGLYLVAIGLSRVLRSYASRLHVTRRLLAFAFRREISNQARDKGATDALAPIDDARWEAIDREPPPGELVHLEVDGHVQKIIGNLDAPGGGMFAVVGERGAGKTTLLTAIARERPRCLVVPCPPGGLAPLRSELCKALGVEPGASDDVLKAAVDRSMEHSAILVDDAHRLVRLEIGGFHDLDTILAFARDTARTCAWIFAMDAATWPLVARARDSRPLFDDVIRLRPWREGSIAFMLRRRSALAGVEPSFERLVTEPLDDDEIERAEQLARVEQNYYRLLWDYSEGNPAVALHFWRASLVQDDAGRVHVQLFPAPDTAALETLPDPALFVLRAVVQLGLAALDDLVRATAIPRDEVADALRHASARGYVEMVDDRYRVHWTWFRAVTRFLQRRHLLAAQGKSI